jgi:large subunit ribosomal protein L25
MKYVEIKAFLRDEKGKSKVKKIREKNYVPAVLYGGENTLIKLNFSDAEKIYNLRHENFLVHLILDGNIKKDAFVKDIQLDPVSNKVIHIDFIELIENKLISIAIPIELKGTSIGVKKGGIIEHFLWEVRVSCLPKDIPEHIEADISNLDIGDSLHIKDLKVPEGVKVIDNPENVILVVGLPTGLREAVEEAAPSEVPVEGETAPATETPEETKKTAPPDETKKKTDEKKEPAPKK